MCWGTFFGQVPAGTGSSCVHAIKLTITTQHVHWGKSQNESDHECVHSFVQFYRITVFSCLSSWSSSPSCQSCSAYRSLAGTCKSDRKQFIKYRQQSFKSNLPESVPANQAVSEVIRRSCFSSDFCSRKHSCSCCHQLKLLNSKSKSVWIGKVMTKVWRSKSWSIHFLLPKLGFKLSWTKFRKGSALRSCQLVSSERRTQKTKK